MKTVLLSSQIYLYVFKNETRCYFIILNQVFIKEGVQLAGHFILDLRDRSNVCEITDLTFGLILHSMRKANCSSCIIEFQIFIRAL